MVLVLVTPTGLAPAGFAVVVFDLGLRAITGAVSGVSKTRGLELPVAERVPSRAIVIVWWKVWSFAGGGDALATSSTAFARNKQVEGKKDYVVADRAKAMRDANDGGGRSGE